MIIKSKWKKQITLILISILIITIFIPFIPTSYAKYQPINKPMNIMRGNDWWDMYRHEPTHFGNSSSTPDSNELLWLNKTDDFISSSPSVSHGKLYVGSWDFYIYCFDMDNGEILWKYKTNDQIFTSPAIFNKRVYIGSKDSKLYCLNANNGTHIWDFKTDSSIESSPTIKDSKVFFGSNDGSLYCLDANDGTYLWSYDAGSIIWSSPAISKDNVYFGTLSGDFICLDAIDGDLIWSFNTTSGIWSSPSIWKEKVYFGSNDNYIYCLDYDDGEFIWSYDTGGEVHSSPAIAYGNVYIGALDRGLFCLKAETGKLVWKFLINGGIWSPPSIANNKVYFGTFPCCGAMTYLRCANASNGEIIWRYNIGENIGMTSSPAIAAGKVFFSTATGKIMAFGKVQYLADANGPYYNNLNVPIQFTGSVYGGKPDYSWYWDFGDGNYSTKQNPIHTYDDIGEFKITLTITDGNNNIALDETLALINKPSNNKPPNKPNIYGPTSGKPGEEYQYNLIVNEPDNDKINILIDWGDGEITDWIGPYYSGEEIYLNHSWKNKGTFSIKVKAKDIYGEESEWGELKVTIPYNKPIIFKLKLINQILECIPNSFPLLKYLSNLISI